jgi:hypothetical protein
MEPAAAGRKHVYAVVTKARKGGKPEWSRPLGAGCTRQILFGRMLGTWPQWSRPLGPEGRERHRAVAVQQPA